MWPRLSKLYLAAFQFKKCNYTFHYLLHLIPNIIFHWHPFGFSCAVVPIENVT